MSRITDEMMQRGIKIGIEIGKERALKMYAAAVRVYRQTGSAAEAAKATGLQKNVGRGCGQKVGLQREATECTQKSRKKWRSENMSDWDR